MKCALLLIQAKYTLSRWGLVGGCATPPLAGWHQVHKWRGTDDNWRRAAMPGQSLAVHTQMANSWRRFRRQLPYGDDRALCWLFIDFVVAILHVWIASYDAENIADNLKWLGPSSDSLKGVMRPFFEASKSLVEITRNLATPWVYQCGDQGTAAGLLKLESL